MVVEFDAGATARKGHRTGMFDGSCGQSSEHHELPGVNHVSTKLRSTPRYPSLYQINTRVWLTELSQSLGRVATLDDVPDWELDRFAQLGFDWLWFLSVWQTGSAAQKVSRTNPGWLKEFSETLTDLRDEDIPGSGFAITGYRCHESLGGDAALARLRKRLHERGLRLMLDFVPNHMALDHPWIQEFPEYFIRGTENDLADAPQNFTRVSTSRGDLVLAHGRDPYFPGWPDTLQLNYANPATQEAMAGELFRIAEQCDGVRCDMAMLILPEVFERTWGQAGLPFWSSTIQRVRDRVPEFVFMAEVYWELEWTLLQQGFDYAYDKRLYDRLRDGHARPVREHFWAGLDFQDKLARFLENHDEPRAAAVFPVEMHEAAAVITFLSPGLRFFQQGQFEGRLKRISPHLSRAPEEPIHSRLKAFYERLMNVLRQPVFRSGKWELLDCAAAWDGNWTSDEFVAFGWIGDSGERRLVVVNYSEHPSQCVLRIPAAGLNDHSYCLKDQLSADVFNREGSDLKSTGLYLDMRPWQAAIYSLSENL